MISHFSFHFSGDRVFIMSLGGWHSFFEEYFVHYFFPFFDEVGFFSCKVIPVFYISWLLTL